MHRFEFVVGSVLAVFLGLSPAVHAGRLATPILASFATALPSPIPSQWRCECVNVSTTKMLTVTVELVDAESGAVKDSETCGIGPGESCCAATWINVTPNDVGFAYCRFTGGSKSTLRGSILFTPEGSSEVSSALAAQ